MPLTNSLARGQTFARIPLGAAPAEPLTKGYFTTGTLGFKLDGLTQLETSLTRPWARPRCGRFLQPRRKSPDGVSEGIAGLRNRMAAAVAELVRKGPDRAVDGVVRWRRVDLPRGVKTRFKVTKAFRVLEPLAHSAGVGRRGTLTCVRTDRAATGLSVANGRSWPKAGRFLMPLLMPQV
jgi:hypothetical protein